MIEYSRRQYLDFEKPIKDLADQLINLQKTSNQSNLNFSDTIEKIEKKIIEKRKEISSNLTPWQKIQLSRHPDRPYSLAFIKRMCDDFIELHGDRNFKDDKAMIGGIGSLDGQSIMFVGQQKGKNTKLRQLRNFGMPNPEGYRKALRLMKIAEKFNIPVVTIIDTPGAFPGIEAEERGQGEAIARNIYEMIKLKVPIVCTIIGEGASGGALGIGVGDKVLMFENTWYSVISPESCSTILWRTTDKKEVAADQLKPTSQDMLNFKLIDEIIPEPIGGTHWSYTESAKTLKKYILKNIELLNAQSAEERISNRIEKFSHFGHFDEE